MKKSIIYTLILFSFACNNSEKGDVKDALKFFLDSAVDNYIKGNYYLNYKFTKYLHDSLLYRDFHNSKLFNDKTIESFVEQNKKYKETELRYLLSDKKYLNRLKKDIVHDTIKYFLDISPPLFTLDHKKFIIYATTVMRKNGKLVWGENYFFFIKKDKRWKFHGIIE